MNKNIAKITWEIGLVGRDLVAISDLGISLRQYIKDELITLEELSSRLIIDFEKLSSLCEQLKLYK